MRRVLAFSLPLLITVFFFGILPSVSPVHGQGLVPCGNGSVSDIANYSDCRVCDLQILAMNLLNFFIIASVLVAALLFVNAGVLYITSPTNPANISKAHRVFMNALIGLLIILGAFLIVGTIMSVLYGDASATRPSEMFGNFGDWAAILDC